ncbi:MAG: hypothetical protein CVT71_03035 [Alphaproteobacteria bacterium HGW-Alphaproteobacteria-10]|nr:MAG: hypothetical protein CVT71_03035 [Alphaproteobacteria bacterium HGW-Alphaproteobacteria-10]
MVHNGGGKDRAQRFHRLAAFFVELVNGGIVFALFGRQALAEDAKVAPYGEGFSGVALAHNVREKSEVDEVLAEAEAAGGRIMRPGGDAFWGGYTGYFADPDNNLWEVAWNPDGIIGEDGSFHFSAG